MVNQTKPKDKIPRFILLANTIMSKETFKCDEETGKLYHYKDGVYYTGEIIIRRLRKQLVNIMAKQFTPRQMDASIRYIKIMTTSNMEDCIKRPALRQEVVDGKVLSYVEGVLRE